MYSAWACCSFRSFLCFLFKKQITTIEMITKTEPSIPAKMIAGWPEPLRTGSGTGETGWVQFGPS